MKINCSYTFNTDVVHDNLFPTLHMLNGWFSDLINWLLADLFIIFSWVCESVRSIFSIWIFFPPFSPSFSDECLHHPTIYSHIYPFIPSVGMHLLTHSLLFIVFAFIKMNFLVQSWAYILSCMPCVREYKPMRRSPSSSACLHTVINSSLV